jgi:putative ABC transport system ATP-binding protein
LIVITNLSRIYQMGDSEIRALDCVSLTVERGEFVALVGSSGSGKSTLLNLIGGLDRPTSGEVKVNNNDLAQMNSKQLAFHRRWTVGMVFQSFNLIPSMTALENVQLALCFAGAPGADRKEKATEILNSLGLSKRMNHKPGELSGGEQQRIALARALANQPAILLADEPTGNLDYQTSFEIMELIKKINHEEGKTILMVTHNEAVAKQYANRIVRLTYGKIIEGDGGHDENI